MTSIFFFVECCFKDLFKTACNILVYFTSSFFSRHFARVYVIQPYSHTVFWLVLNLVVIGIEIGIRWLAVRFNTFAYWKGNSKNKGKKLEMQINFCIKKCLTLLWWNLKKILIIKTCSSLLNASWGVYNHQIGMWLINHIYSLVWLVFMAYQPLLVI